MLVGTEPPGRNYRREKLPDLAAGPPAAGGTRRVEEIPYRPRSILDVPPVSFGDTDLPRAGVDEAPVQGAAGRQHRLYAISAFVLRDAVVHGKSGVVTLGDRVVDDMLDRLQLRQMPGARWEDGMHLRLPDRPLAATVPQAYHLLAGYQDNYFHFLFDAMSRFTTADYRGMGRGPAATGETVLLSPRLDQPWKRQMMDLAVPPGLPCGVLAEDAAILVRRLIYLPTMMTSGGLYPHLGLVSVLDRIRAAAYALNVPVAPPWRRLYIARTDTRIRRLVNETEIIALAARAGFECVTLSRLPVAEQVRMFAEASHILAPHGAGLANIGFCRPGAVLCELHMDRYTHWTFRHLAARRGVRYGCVIGSAIEQPPHSVHGTSWRINPEAVAAVLCDPRFIGP